MRSRILRIGAAVALAAAAVLAAGWILWRAGELGSERCALAVAFAILLVITAAEILRSASPPPIRRREALAAAAFALDLFALALSLFAAGAALEGSAGLGECARVVASYARERPEVLAFIANRTDNFTWFGCCGAFVEEVCRELARNFNLTLLEAYRVYHACAALWGGWAIPEMLIPEGARMLAASLYRAAAAAAAAGMTILVLLAIWPRRGDG